MSKTLLTILALLILVGCVPNSTPKDDDISLPEWTHVYNSGMSNVYRFVDAEAQVVCYLFNGYSKGGISCLPLSETTLEE